LPQVKQRVGPRLKIALIKKFNPDGRNLTTNSDIHRVPDAATQATCGMHLSDA
jgi:hypothetical protein